MKKLLFPLLLLIISIFSLINFGCVKTPEVKKSQDEASAPQQNELLPLYKIVGRINKEQPISIGEVIYIESVYVLQATMYYPSNNTYTYEYKRRCTVSYTYMGIDDKNNFKIIYNYEYKPHEGVKGFGPRLPYKEETLTNKVETLGLLLPLNQNKQMMLKVKSFELDPELSIVSKKELIITLVDKFYRITVTVEEIGNTQTK